MPVKYFFFYITYLFPFGCVGSSLLCVGFLELYPTGLLFSCRARASRCGGFSCWGVCVLGLTGSRSFGMWASVVVVPGL